MEFEDILCKVGGYGKYQKLLTIFFLVPISWVLSWITFDGLFVLSVPEHWCYVEDVASSNLSLSDQRALVSSLDDPSCSMHDLNYTDFIAEVFPVMLNGTAVIPCDSGWQYSKKDYDSTASTKWNLVCNRSYFGSLIIMLQNLGSLLSAPVYGYLADRYGRKRVYFIMGAIPLVAGIVSVFVEDLIVFIVMRTLYGSVVPTMYTIAFILVIEIVEPEMRAHINGIMNFSWTVGLSLLALVAYVSRSWTILTLVCSFGCACNLLYYRYIPESPGWLTSIGRYGEASIVMEKIGKRNGKCQDRNDLFNNLKALGAQKQEEKNENVSFSLFKYPRIRKHFIIITYCQTAFFVAYFGPMYNLSNLAGNEFFNFFLLSIVEIPGNLLFWVIMDRVGRRWTAAIGYTVVGFSCLGPLTGFQYSDIICSMIGKLISSGLFMVTEQQGTELFPTVARSFGMSLGKTIAHAVTLLIPFFADLGAHGKDLPFIVMGLMSLVAGILTSFLPETLNENMPQTLSDAEEFGKDHEFWTWRRKTNTAPINGSLKYDAKTCTLIDETYL